MKESEVKKAALKVFEEIWKPLLFTKGKLDYKKVRTEMLDLIFIYKQVSTVYCEITGNKLSKPMYYADSILEEYNNQLNDSYENGYEDGQFEAPGGEEK